MRMSTSTAGALRRGEKTRTARREASRSAGVMAAFRHAQALGYGPSECLPILRGDIKPCEVMRWLKLPPARVADTGWNPPPRPSYLARLVGTWIPPRIEACDQGVLR